MTGKERNKVEKWEEVMGENGGCIREKAKGESRGCSVFGGVRKRVKCILGEGSCYVGCVIRSLAAHTQV